MKVLYSWMNFKRVLELVKCWAFPLTLSGLPQFWYSRLPLRSIISFKQQAQLFITHFLGTTDQEARQPPNDLQVRF